MFSAKNGKVFVFVVKFYKRVFHPNIFSHMLNFSSLWGWEGDWLPTGHQLVTFPYFMFGDWSHCMMCYFSELGMLLVANWSLTGHQLVMLSYSMSGTGHIAWHVTSLSFYYRLTVLVAIACLLPSKHPWMSVTATARMRPIVQWDILGGRLWPGWLNIVSWLWPTKEWHLWPTTDWKRRTTSLRGHLLTNSISSMCSSTTSGRMRSSSMPLAACGTYRSQF